MILLYHFDHKFTRCYVLWVNLLSSLVHKPKLPLEEIFKFMYKKFKQLIKPLWVCNGPADSACMVLLVHNSNVDFKHIT